MVLRQEPATQEQRIKNVQQGVEHAKDAVSLDTSDGTSWAILGNAYLSSFFTVQQNPATLRLCMSAYNHAVRGISQEEKIYSLSSIINKKKSLIII